jgi:hypothetical protein
MLQSNGLQASAAKKEIPNFNQKYTSEQQKTYSDLLHKMSKGTSKEKQEAVEQLKAMPLEEQRNVKQFKEDLVFAVQNNKKLEQDAAQIDANLAKSKADLEKIDADLARITKAEAELEQRRLDNQAREKNAVALLNTANALNKDIAVLTNNIDNMTIQRDAILGNHAKTMVTGLNNYTTQAGGKSNTTVTTTANKPVMSATGITMTAVKK